MSSDALSGAQFWVTHRDGDSLGVAPDGGPVGYNDARRSPSGPKRTIYGNPIAYKRHTTRPGRQAARPGIKPNKNL